jgi:gamma-glutamyltranspeptidase/glutathione hydrolase
MTKPMARAWKMVNILSLRASSLTKRLSRLRRRAGLSAAALMVLGGCEVAQTLPDISMFESTSYFGGAVADEPRAALVARDVLAAGGNAADAAVALYFTLAVTYPSTASLGGGGLCLVYKPDDDDGDSTEIIEFLAPPAARHGQTVRRPSAIPGNVRGMYALQARYGRLKWSQLLAPAEAFARLGHQVSRALARDLRLAGPSLFNDPELRKIFQSDAGVPVAEGDLVRQLELGAVLSHLRIRGAGDFYNGSVARNLAAGIARAEGALTTEELRAYRPQWTESVSFPFGHHTIHTAPPPVAGGLTAAAMFALLSEDDRFLDTPDEERAHLVAEISKRAFADRQNWLDDAAPFDMAGLRSSMTTYNKDRPTALAALTPPPKRRLENPAATSFITMDKRGLTVICAVTMNNLFGTGRVVPGTGILLAAAPAPSGNATTSLAPVILVNHNTSQLFFAAGSIGGAAAPSALASVMRGALLENMPLRDAIRAPRLHHGGMPDRVLVEPNMPAAKRQSLSRRQHDILEVPEIGRVNAIHCPGGMPRSPETCLFESDQRGFGLASGGEL